VGVILILWKPLSRDANDPQSGFGPPAYVKGRNAQREECRELRQAWVPMINRQAEEDRTAEDRDGDALERLDCSAMSAEEKDRAAKQQLFVGQDLAKTARESRQEQEVDNLRARMLAEGCLVPNQR
jgi:hypothetical protein